jgi:uncharacterized membrane protein YphA (DoxX/SURF4 family)
LNSKRRRAREVTRKNHLSKAAEVEVKQPVAVLYVDLMAKLAPIGRLFYAIGIVAFGILHLAHGAFVTRVAPPLPTWIPWPGVWACLVGIALVIAGAALIAQFRFRIVAVVLGASVLLSALFLHLPAAVATPFNGGLWTNVGKALAVAGGAFVIAAGYGAAERRSALSAAPGASSFEKILPWGRFLFAAFLILSGVQHFTYFDFVQMLVPAWIPAHGFWTSLSGAALIAGGIGIALPFIAPIAAFVTANMIFVWLLVLHLPRALSDVQNTNETTAVFEALAMSGIAFMLTTTPKPRPQVLEA